MVKAALIGFLKEISNKIAAYTKYVHFVVYGSVWALFVLLFSLGDFPIYVPLVLGGIVNLLIGGLFWFFPAFLVKHKSKVGKNWNPLLSVINLGLLQYVVLSCWSIFFFVVIASSFFGSSKDNADRPSLLIKSCEVTQQRKALQKPLAWGAESAFEKIRFERLRAAAEGGDAEAQTDFGLAYDRGEGTSQDYEESFMWFRFAADQGYARAQYNVGVAYDRGEGVSQDYKEALKWYRLAADQGYANAQFSIGIMYVNGKGVPQGFQETLKWYKLAADQGCASAQFNLAQIYYEEKGGVPQDYEAAFKLYALAAEQGDADAQCCLGRSYLKGHGTKFDFELGMMFNKLAFDNGDPCAESVLKILEKNMKPRDIRKIQRMAKEWRRNHGQ